jgi:hypothetical protein
MGEKRKNYKHFKQKGSREGFVTLPNVYSTPQEGLQTLPYNTHQPTALLSEEICLLVTCYLLLVTCFGKGYKPFPTCGNGMRERL